MSEAAFSDVLEVILIILLVYFGFKILIRWFGPILLRYFLKRVGKQFEKKFGQFNQQQKTPDTSSLNKKPAKRKKSNNEVGEYIDYEEID